MQILCIAVPLNWYYFECIYQNPLMDNWPTLKLTDNKFSLTTNSPRRILVEDKLQKTNKLIFRVKLHTCPFEKGRSTSKGYTCPQCVCMRCCVGELLLMSWPVSESVNFFYICECLPVVFRSVVEFKRCGFK